jgi:hypothetical protein
VALGGDIVTGPASAAQALRTLSGAPAFQALDANTRAELTGAVDRVAGYLEADPAAALSDPLAGQLAGPGDLRQRMGAAQPGVAPQPASPAAGQPSPAAAPAPGAPAAGGGGTIGRVGEATRATLGAIDFPQFVASLIQGTFKAIVDASIQQMEAYAALLKNVAGTVDRFMDDNVTEGMAKDHLATEHPWLFKKETSKGTPELVTDRTANRELPGFLKDLGFSAPAEIDKTAVQEVVVPATRRTLAETRQSTLATMVLLGIIRVVVDDGEIKAKLMFHIDASETTSLKFDQQKATTGNMAGEAGTGMFNAQALMVNTASINAQSDINIRADLTGEVRVKFRSETFPLERFADSAAIQLINSNAKVPERPPAPAAAAPPAAAPPARAPAAPAPPPAVAPAPAPPAPAPAPAAPVAGQEALASEDPWLP